MSIRQVSIPLRRGMPRGLIPVVLAALAMSGALSWPSAPARAEENKIWTATKTSLYGAAAGALLGSVALLVEKRDPRLMTVRWGVVIGTFGGFAYGLWDVGHQHGDLSLVPRVRGRDGDLSADALEPMALASAASRSAAAIPQGHPGRRLGQTSFVGSCGRMAGTARHLSTMDPAAVRRTTR